MMNIFLSGNSARHECLMLQTVSISLLDVIFVMELESLFLMFLDLLKLEHILWGLSEFVGTS
jgi:hypothetical protein